MIKLKCDITNKICWDPIKEAKTYQVELSDENEKIINTIETANTFIALSDIMADSNSGNYNVRVGAIDENGAPLTDYFFIVYTNAAPDPIIEKPKEIKDVPAPFNVRIVDGAFKPVDVFVEDVIIPDVPAVSEDILG